MCAAAAEQTFSKLDLTRYERYDFNGEVVSLKTAEPHLTEGYETVDKIVTATQRVLSDLASYVQDQYPELTGLSAPALRVKDQEYRELEVVFRNYHSYVENAEHYLSDLRRATHLFKRPRLCATDDNTFALLDPQFSAQIREFLTNAEKQVADLKQSQERMTQKVNRLVNTQTDIDNWLGWYGKAIADGGKIGITNTIRQYWKARDHLG